MARCDLKDRVIIVAGTTGSLNGSAADYLAGKWACVDYLGRARNKLDVAKAAVENFTRWVTVDLAQRSKGGIRFNAVMPGFFLGEQNRHLLTLEDGRVTDRGETIWRNTSLGCFGQADALRGALHYLLSDAYRFVTGTNRVVHGGFTAFSGV